MDLLKGITKKAQCYRAYILTNTMQEGEERRRGGGEERKNASRGGGSDMGGRDIRGNSSTHQRRQERRGVPSSKYIFYRLCLQPVTNYALMRLCGFSEAVFSSNMSIL